MNVSNLSTGYFQFPLPIFIGDGREDEDIEKFQFMMDARKFIDGWTDIEDVRNLLRSLGEPALRTVMKEKLECRDTYSKVMDILVTSYSTTMSNIEAYSKLMVVKQDQNQSVIKFAKYFKKLLSATQANFTEQVKIHHFRRGLFVIEDGFAILEGRAKTLEEAVDIAENRETVRNIRIAETEKHKKSDNTMERSKKTERIDNIPSVADLAKEFAKLQLLLENQKPKNFFCSFCKTDSHPRGKCPDVECFKCHKKGHIAPRCTSISNDSLPHPTSYDSNSRAILPSHSGN